MCGTLQIQEINESPVHLQLNPDLDPSRKELPVQLYETGMSFLPSCCKLALFHVFAPAEMHVLDGVATTAFVKAKHTIEVRNDNQCTNVGTSSSMDLVCHRPQKRSALALIRWQRSLPLE